MEEEWRPVIGYEGLYEVSSEGRVRSLDRVVEVRGRGTRKVPGKMLSLGVTKAGYHVAVLSKQGRGVTNNVHVLVATAFLDNPDNHPLVRHLNDVGADNRVQNLSWGTYSQNRLDAVRSGSYVNQYHLAEKCIRGHLFSEENTYRMPSGGRSCRACRRDREKENA